LSSQQDYEGSILQLAEGGQYRDQTREENQQEFLNIPPEFLASSFLLLVPDVDHQPFDIVLLDFHVVVGIVYQSEPLQPELVILVEVHVDLLGLVFDLLFLFLCLLADALFDGLFENVDV